MAAAMGMGMGGRRSPSRCSSRSRKTNVCEGSKRKSITRSLTFTSMNAVERCARTDMRRSAQTIGKEVMEDAAPKTLLRDGDVAKGSGVDNDNDNARKTRMRTNFEKMIRDAQDKVCAAVEKLEAEAAEAAGSTDVATFRSDAWTRAEGGGGISKIIQDGKVFEKAGVNVSVVYGSMPPEVRGHYLSTLHCVREQEFLCSFIRSFFFSFFLFPHLPLWHIHTYTCVCGWIYISKQARKTDRIQEQTGKHCRIRVFGRGEIVLMRFYTHDSAELTPVCAYVCRIRKTDEVSTTTRCM